MELNDQMQNSDKETGKHLRRHPRIKTAALVSYTAFDDDGSMTSQGMATTTNVSQGGLQMELFEELDVKRATLMATDQNSRQASVNVEIIYCERTGRGTYLSGVRFDDSRQNTRHFIGRLIRGFHYRRVYAS